MRVDPYRNIPHHAVGIVSAPVGDGHSVFVLLDGAMGSQIGALPCDVATYGPRDAVRMHSPGLPTEGTRVLVAFPRNDHRNGVVIGSIAGPFNDASALTPSDPHSAFNAHWSGYWDVLNPSGQFASVTPDGSALLLGFSGIPQLTRHTVDSSQVRQRTPYTQDQRVAKAPPPIPVWYLHKSGTKFNIDTSGNVTVTAAQNQTITYQVSGGGSIVISGDGSITATSKSSQPITLQVSGGGEVVLNGDGSITVAAESGQNVNITGNHVNLAVASKKVALDGDPVVGGHVQSTATNVYAS